MEEFDKIEVTSSTIDSFTDINSSNPDSVSNTPEIYPPQSTDPPPTAVMSTNNSRSLIDMPSPKSKQAPEKFKGHYTMVREFIQEYEHLCARNNVTSDQDKVETIRRYCSKKVREVLEGMKNYNTPNWDEFKKEMLRYYNDDRNQIKFTERDLKDLVKESRQEKISGIDDFRDYERKFVRIAGWLKAKGKSSSSEYDKAFWKGLPKAFRYSVEEQML